MKKVNQRRALTVVFDEDAWQLVWSAKGADSLGKTVNRLIRLAAHSVETGDRTARILELSERILAAVVTVHEEELNANKEQRIENLNSIRNEPV